MRHAPQSRMLITRLLSTPMVSGRSTKQTGSVEKRKEKLWKLMVSAPQTPPHTSGCCASRLTDNGRLFVPHGRWPHPTDNYQRTADQFCQVGCSGEEAPFPYNPYKAIASREGEPFPSAALCHLQSPSSQSPPESAGVQAFVKCYYWRVQATLKNE